MEIKLSVEASKKYRELRRMGYFVPQLIEDHITELYAQAIRDKERRETKQ